MSNKININIQKFFIFFGILFALYITTIFTNKYLAQQTENFDIKTHVFDYQFPMNRAVYKDLCPIQGTIEQIDNPNIDSCYITNYIPYIFNVGNYVSEIMPSQ